MRSHCDKCLSPIENGKCSCGYWYENNEMPPFANLFAVTISAFNNMETEIFSGDHIATGIAFVYFKGDFEMCEKVKKYIRKLQSKQSNMERLG